jgi:hypothetical protein
MLDWLTFIASAVAATGAVLGPIVAYRSASRALRREEEQTRRDRRQERVDVAVQYALSDNPVIAEMGVKQLLYLLQAGELTGEQKVSVVSAMEASLELTAQTLGSGEQRQAVLATEADDRGRTQVAWVTSEGDVPSERDAAQRDAAPNEAGSDEAGSNDAGQKGDRP